jgi:hypothetical protein
MSNADVPLSDLVVVDAGFKPAVHLPDDFDKQEQNAQLIKTYIPTSQSITFLAEVARSFNSASNERARMLVGTFGTGKSDLLLILCNYFSRPVDDPLMQPFYEKLQRINESLYTTIYQHRANRQPFLVVLLQANAVEPFPGFILYGLEQALRRVGLEDLMLPTRYAAAIQKIEEWQCERHPVLQSFIAALRDNEAKELVTLINDLSSPGADLVFPVFQRAFRIATGTAFDIHTYNRPEQTYKQVAQSLRERGSHSGILVVCDEFTEVLRRLARAGEQQAAEVEVEALGVQDLANTSVASGQNQLHFVVSSLESFASSAADSTASTGSKVEKFGGRFKTFELEMQDSAELMRGAIRRLNQTNVLPNRQRDELVELVRSLTQWRQKGKQWLAEMVVEGCFPLHPLVTYALPLINRLVAQTNRTMFLFLKDQDGLGGFLAQYTLASPYPNWSNLLTLDRLFDYFEKSIQVRRSDITDSYNHSRVLLQQANVDTTLARRALKVVAICEVIEPNLTPNRLLIRHALNLPPSTEPELIAALALLEQLGALYAPNDAEGEALGAYSLPMVGRINPRNLHQQVNRKAQELYTSVNRLQESHPAESIKADAYNRQHGSDRELKARFVGMVDLNSSTLLKKDLEGARDGLLWYVIVSSENERSDAQSRARELTRQNPRLVVAVPVIPLTVLEALKNYEALNIVRNDPTLDTSAKTYLQDIGLVGKGFHSVLIAAVARLREEKQWEWFREGVSQPNIINRAQAQDLASKVMTAVYPHTPEHQLAQHFKPEGISTSLTKAMAIILRGEVRISKNGKAAEEIILRSAMTSLGLLKSLRIEGPHEIFSLTEPTGSSYNSQKIWQMYVSHLSARKPWAKLLEALRKEPYGLYDSLLAAFTTVFLTLHADGIDLTLATNNQPSVLDERVLKDLIDKPQNYNVRLHPLTDLERQWLNGIVTVGLRKQPDSGSGHGKTLRMRVAAQVKTWLNGLRLPVFAEKLDAAQLTALLPDTATPIVAAAVVLLQCPRTEEALAGILLNEIPLALGAQEHSNWTSESLKELLAVWAETCRMLEQLPNALLQHATRAVTTVFGCEEATADNHWNHIFRWRMNRRILDTQISDMSSYVRTMFRLTGQPISTIRDAFLNEFAQTITGINTAYQMWPTIDHLDRLIKEIQKARNEIDSRWRAVANAEDVWHDGLASAASGRPMSGVSAEDVATYLQQWVAGVIWPSCAPMLQPAELQLFYPTLDTPICTDVSAILKRTQYLAEDWARELDDTLSKQFGIEGWTKAEVERAVARLRDALKHAANLDAFLRKHTLALTLKPFAPAAGGDATPGVILTSWRESRPIPAENDLDENAQILLGQIDSSSDAETTLLIALPRALPQIAQSYQQWRSYADLKRYVSILIDAVAAINSYTPLSDAEQRWLSKTVTVVLHRPLINPPREKHRLAAVVGEHFADWLRQQDFPGFVATLTATELRDLFPQATAAQIATIGEVLRSDEKLRTDPGELLLVDLPVMLGASLSEEVLSEEVVESLLPALAEICWQISELKGKTTQRLLAEIGPIFGVGATEDGPNTLLSRLRAWRQSYVLFANEPLSPDAALISDALSASTDDPLKLLLDTLPGKLCEVRVPYGSWRSWDQRRTYLNSLSTAAKEISQRGQVSEATPHVRNLWERLKEEISNLSRDEQRWLIKAFDEEFPT